MWIGYLRQSTAATRRTPQFVGVDGLTEQTAISSPAGRITKNGTASAFTAASWAHDANGYYLMGLSTSHTDTIGTGTIQFASAASYLSVTLEFTVLHAAVYDWLFGSTAPSTYAGGAVASVTAPVTVGTVNDKTGYSLSQAFPANFSSLGINASGHVTRVVLADTLTTYTGNTPQTGDAYARIGANGAGLTAIPDPAGVGTLLARITSTRADSLDAIPDLATASQIPADFTDATFASAGVFAAEALANVPAVGGGPVQLDADQPLYAPARAGDAMTLEAGERADLAAAILDLADGVESGETLRQTLRLLRAVLAGRAVAGTGTVAFRRKDGTTVALTVSHDDAGNRTASTVGTL